MAFHRRIKQLDVKEKKPGKSRIPTSTPMKNRKEKKSIEIEKQKKRKLTKAKTVKISKIKMHFSKLPIIDC